MTTLIPRLWIGLSIAVAAGIVHGCLILWAPAGPALRATQIAMHVVTALVYMASTLICWRVARDHQHRSTMRLAWLLFTGSAALSVVRHAYETLSLVTGWVDTNLTTIVSLRQIPIALSLIVLTAGLAAVWSSFTAIGMGLRFRIVDLALLGLIVALVPSTFLLREEMGDAQSSYAFIRHLQSASPLLLAAPALIGVMLHRISHEMGGGRVALALRCIVAFLVVRLLSLYIGLAPGVQGTVIVARAFWWAAAWLFLLAAAYRWSVTLSAGALADRYESDPDAELAGASRAIASRDLTN